MRVTLTSRGKVTKRTSWSVNKSKTKILGGHTTTKSSIDVLIPLSRTHNLLHLSARILYTEINFEQLKSPFPAACQPHDGYAYVHDALIYLRYFFFAKTEFKTTKKNEYTCSRGELPEGNPLGMKLRVAGTPDSNLGVAMKILCHVISKPVGTVFSATKLLRKAGS